MHVEKKDVVQFIKDIDKRTVLLAMVISLAIAYYIDPLSNVGLTENWNRTFSPAILAGISIDARIENFYKYFFIILIMSICLTALLSLIFKIRAGYKEWFERFGILSGFFVLASYISRYTSDSSDIQNNSMLSCFLAFFVMLTAVALADKLEVLKFEELTLLFLSFIICVMTCSLLFQAEGLLIYICIVGPSLCGFVIAALYWKNGSSFFGKAKNFFYLLLWLPAVIKGALEGIYFLTEKGWAINRYYTHIGRVTLIFVLSAMLFIWITRKKKVNLKSFGYIGSIISVSVIGLLPYSYQYIISCKLFTFLYEYGNVGVAVDTYLYGKLPIVDYFSAHALGDVWARLLYCFVHNDVKGILINPLNLSIGLSTMVGMLVLFLIIRELFDEDSSILYVLIFPGIVTGIKWTSICCISVAALLIICRKPSRKSYIAFWLCVLISAFYTYDEGISLGMACIAAYSIGCLLTKDWKAFRRFAVCGASVGGTTLAAYVVYAIATGLPVLGRIKEWLSVSAGSSSSWATESFGDKTSFAFLLSYFIVPITAISLLLFVIVRYVKSRKHLTLTVVTVAYSLTELLYITRTIVYHNLAVCSGSTGVLLNFVHWTVAVYVLYVLTLKEKSETIKLFAFTGTMLAVILLEGIAVTQYLPSADSSLLNKGLESSKTWNLRDGYTENVGKERIIYDEDTEAMIGQFRTVFDTLLSEEQTFLDFANITSMYLMTDRVRPCYVGQSPSLLTDLYSQQCFLEEISEYDCPLVVMGTTETQYVQQMIGIPHNIRYYTIAEYIYQNYRPLIAFGEFAIWCEKDSYNEFRSVLLSEGFADSEYTFIDYGYDFTTYHIDEDGVVQFEFMPYHSYDLGEIPYIWSHYDEQDAIHNEVLCELQMTPSGSWQFDGSQNVVNENGNYIAFEVTNSTDDDMTMGIVFFDSKSEKEGAKTNYTFTVKPGTNEYLIRVSADYFWDIYNVDTVLFDDKEELLVDKVRILEGD